MQPVAEAVGQDKGVYPFSVISRLLKRLGKHEIHNGRFAMHRRSGRAVRSILTLALGTWVLCMGLNPVAQAASTLTLEQAAHFVESDGSDVLVEAGTYEVETWVGSRLRLNMEGRETVFLDAHATTHSEEIEAPLAITVNGEDPDVVHLVLLLPNGQALDAPGSISGTRSRGFSSILVSKMQIQVAVAKNQPTVRDHRQPKRITPQPTAPPTASPAPNIGKPGMVGPLTGTLALPDQYQAPTANLTMVANAVRLTHKSLTTLITAAPNLPITTSVEISIGYYSPAGNQRITQSYVRATGNRFLYNDKEGDGKPRRMRVDISLREQLSNGEWATFALPWQASLDPLYDVTISPLNFKLRDDCDKFGDSEIKFRWSSPDKAQHIFGFRARAGWPIHVGGFAWRGLEVSVSQSLLYPRASFMENDSHIVNFGRAFADCIKELGCPFKISGIFGGEILLPGNTHIVEGDLMEADRERCRAHYDYKITYTLRFYPYL